MSIILLLLCLYLKDRVWTAVCLIISQASITLRAHISEMFETCILEI